MMRRSLHILVMMLLLGASGALFGQSKNEQRGDDAYADMEYKRAAQYYFAAWQDENSPELAAKLGQSLLELRRYDQAQAWLARAVDGNLNVKAPVVRLYADALKANGFFFRAQTQYLRANELSGGASTQDIENAMACEYAAAMFDDSLGYIVSSVPFNSPWSDIAPSGLNNQLVFASNRPRGYGRELTNGRDDGRFYDLYAAAFESADSYSRPRLMAGGANSAVHDGPLSREYEGTVYLTRSGGAGGAVIRNGEGTGLLKLFACETSGGRRIGNPKQLSFTEDEYNYAHASLSPDGDWLYFSSDRPGGRGGMDIWRTKISGDKFEEPENLGETINTAGNEIYPFAPDKQVLYFSSDGHPGMGGQDIFYTFQEDRGWHSPQNGGYPLNSFRDDFGITFTKSRPIGWISSNRDGGKGSDDIYRIERRFPIRIDVKHKGTGEPLAGVNISIVDTQNNEFVLHSDERGDAVYYGLWGRDYQVSLSLPGFTPQQTTVHTGEVSPFSDYSVNANLEPVMTLAVVGEVKEEGTETPLSFASVKLISETEEVGLITGERGTFLSPLEPENDYTVLITHPGHIPARADLSTKDMAKPDAFVLQPRLKPGKGMLIDGRATLFGTEDPIGGARMFALKGGVKIDSAVANPTGRFFMILEEGSADLIAGEYGELHGPRIPLTANNWPLDTTIAVFFREKPDFAKGQVLAVAPYEYRDANLNDRARHLLDQAADILLRHPQLRIEVAAHTDERGTDAFNLRLSRKRAKAAFDYLVDKGIDQSRIQSTGFGESKLIQACPEEGECPEEVHARNRRVEVIIISD